MNRAAVSLGLVFVTAAALVPRDACAQARGLSYWQSQEDGQYIQAPAERREEARQQALDQALDQALELAEQERIALLDPVFRARKIEELDAFLRRLPGRFRIEGRIEGTVHVSIAGGQPGIPASAASVARHRNITGIADCAAVGEGVGLNCIMTATWPVLEDPPKGPMAFSGPPPPSEALGTVRPAVLVMGLNMEPLGIRALMVTADTLAQPWTGKLERSSATLRRSSPCFEVRCYQMLEIAAAPDDDLVSFIFKAGALTMTVTLHRDPQAELAKPVKPMKAR